MEIRIPLELFSKTGGAHLLVDCKLNNELEGQLILDTGASKTVLNSSLIEQIAEEMSVSEFIARNPDEQVEELIDDHDLAEEIGASDEGMVSTGVSGPIDMRFGEVALFEILDFRLENASFSFTDLSAVHRIYDALGGKNVLGLLGGDILAAYNAIIDYPNKVLVLSSHNLKY